MNEEALCDHAGRIGNDRARENWLKFMRSVELESKEVESYEDDSDGVTPLAASELREAGRERLVHVEETVDNPFETSEQIKLPTGVNARGRHGLTALHMAVEDGDYTRVRELLKLGADRHITDNSGHTPADKAALLGDLDLLAMLK